MKKLFSVCFLISFCSLTLAQNTIIHCGSLIDGISDKPLNEYSIVIEVDRIVKVVKGYLEHKDGDVLIDLKGYTVMPGFIDLHVHLESEASKTNYMDRFTKNEADVAFKSTLYAHRTLMAGFTTVRDVGGSGVNISLRNAINSGIIVGPRIFTSGNGIKITGGHGDPTNGFKQDLMGDPGPKYGVVNGVDDAIKAVRQRYKNGADLIKISATGGVLSVAKDGSGPHLKQEEIEAIVNTAKDFGFHVAAHAHGKEGMKRAVLAGVTTIEHGTYMDVEVMKLMKEKGTYYIPTILAGVYVSEKAAEKGFYPDVVAKKAAEIGPLISDTFKKAYKYGVAVGFGTDAGVYPHGMNAREFELMTAAGMKPMDAIICATSVNASILKRKDQFGSIKVGLFADIVAVKGDPLKDIGILKNIDFVMKEGVVYKDQIIR